MRPRVWIVAVQQPNFCDLVAAQQPKCLHYEFTIPYPAAELRFDSVGNKTAELVNFAPFALLPGDIQPDGEGPFSLGKLLGLGTNLVGIMIGCLNITDEQVLWT